jgi:hypothetical protein
MLDKRDLLFAHGCMCAYVREHKDLDLFFAHRWRDVINNFQQELRAYLKPDACDFHVRVTPTGRCVVEPIGGWDENHRGGLGSEN